MTSFARRALALTAAVAAAAGISLATAATAGASVRPAETGSCGPACVEPYFQSSGSQWVQRDHDGTTAVNNLVNVNYATTSSKAEDWLPVAAGDVDGTYCPATSGVPALDPIFSANQCNALDNDGYGSDTAWQLRYEPLGTDTHLCAGLWDNTAAATAGLRIRTVPCGVSADTVWIRDSGDGRWIGGVFYAPQINGASGNFSDPLVVTETTGAPAYQALRVQPVSADSNGIVDSRQLMAFLPGL